MRNVKVRLWLLVTVLTITACIAPTPQNAFESPLYNRRLYLPIIAQQRQLPVVVATPTPTPCFRSEAAEQFYRLLVADARQQRKSLVCDPRLVAAAEARAMAQRGDVLSHCDEDKVCANDYARRYGCRLPTEGYGSGNQIESLVAGTPNALAAFESLARSEGHSNHLFGKIDLFRAQDRIGIAMVEVPGYRWRWAWSILIARCG